MTSDPSSGPAGGSCVIFAMASGFHDVGEGEIGRKVTGIADQMIVRFAAACGARAADRRLAHAAVQTILGVAAVCSFLCQGCPVGQGLLPRSRYDFSVVVRGDLLLGQPVDRTSVVQGNLGCVVVDLGFL